MDRGSICGENKLAGSKFGWLTIQVPDRQWRTSFSNSVRRSLTSPGAELVRRRGVSVSVMVMVSGAYITMYQIATSAQDKEHSIQQNCTAGD